MQWRIHDHILCLCNFSIYLYPFIVILTINNYYRIAGVNFSSILFIHSNKFLQWYPWTSIDQAEGENRWDRKKLHRWRPMVCEKLKWPALYRENFLWLFVIQLPSMFYEIKIQIPSNFFIWSFCSQTILKILPSIYLMPLLTHTHHTYYVERKKNYSHEDEVVAWLFIAQ